MNKKTYIAPAINITAMMMQGHLLTLSNITVNNGGTGSGEDIMGGTDGTTSTEHPLDAKEHHYSAWETWNE